jgi:hypothetical protein
MRVADRPLPEIVLDTVPVLDGWPVRPVLAIAGRRDVLEWDDPDLEWDAPGLEWDEDLVPGFVDATCVWMGLETEAGNPDEHGNMAASSLIAQLDNRTGEWSQYRVDGTPAAYGPGLELLLWATDGTDAWWIFAGTITRWDERADDTIEVEAFDVFSDLAQPIGDYLAGVAGQTMGPRSQAILDVAGRGQIRRRLAVGLNTLTAQITDDAPLEQLEVVAGSDGGRLFPDADGTLVLLARNWRQGRDDQTVIPVISDNVCTAPVVIWDPTLSTNDTGLADTVVLTNIAKLRAQNPATISGNVLTETDQQWTTQLEGDTLAAELLNAQAAARVALDEFDLYLLDPAHVDVWRAVDWRLFDVLRFLHDSRSPDGVQRIDLGVLVASLAHSITPDGWIMTVSTSRAVSYATGLYWDTTLYAWNDAGAVWGY